MVAAGLLPGDPAGAAQVGASPHLSSSQVVETWSTTNLPGPSNDPLQDGNGPIAESSPVLVDLDGQESVAVGDRRGLVYAFHLGSPTGPAGAAAPVSVAGWPTTDESGSIDSTPSVTTQADGQPEVLVGSGSGDAQNSPLVGGYQAYGPSGSRLWFTPVVNLPQDVFPDNSVQASMSVGNLQTGTDTFAGSLGQVAYSLNARTGSVLRGWPYYDSDSTHATAAMADLYGTGQTEIVVGGDQSTGFAEGQQYAAGGHLRILSGTGNLICRADTNQTVESSPAVGGFLVGGATGEVMGTGAFFPGASDTDTVKAYDNRCQLQWSVKVDGATNSSPALSNILGNGSLQVVEGTSSGSVYALNGGDGQTIWKTSGLGTIIGSVVTADLTDSGYDDVVVPTTHGTYLLDGRTGAKLLSQPLSPNLGLQNSPLITRDPNGSIGITLAGYEGSSAFPGGIGDIDHYEITGSNGAEAVGGKAWPMFHHDPQLTGDAGGTTPRGSLPACSVPAAALTGYELAAADGGVFSFGTSPFCGSTGNLRLKAPVVGITMAPDSGGYWEVASDGGIFAFGGAGFYGSTGNLHLNRPVVGMAATNDGKGYWLVASDGGIFAFGDARFMGSTGSLRLRSPVVGMAVTADGGGYRLVASDGGVFTFGDAQFDGSMGGQHLNAPIVALATDTNTGGYWEVASDGGIFAFGAAPFFGSTGSLSLTAPIVGMAATSNGSGYGFAAADGGVFTFASPFFGSMGGKPLGQPIVGMAGF